MPLDPHETRYLHDPIEQFARNDRLKYSDVAGDAWVILVQFPDVSEAQVASASAFTVAKTFAFAACFAYALVVVVVAVARRFLGRRPTG